MQFYANYPSSGAAGGVNPSVGVNGAPAPADSTEIGFIDNSNNLQGVSSSNPLPVTLISDVGELNVNLNEVNGAAVNVGIGTSGTGTQRVAVSSDSTINTIPQVNTNGSVSNSTSVTTTATTFSPPTNAVGFVVEAESSNTVNLRYACGTTATTTVGMLLEPGRDSGFIPSKGIVTVCAVSGSGQAASIQWILTS